MGGTPTQWRLGDVVLDPIAEIRKELEAGKEIPLADIKPAHGGLLTYEGQQVVLYIKSPKQSVERLKYAENGPRFHLADCQKINEMRDSGKLERYVATTRKDGIFLLEPLDPFTNNSYKIETELIVCKFCLGHVNWKNHQD